MVGTKLIFRHISLGRQCTQCCTVVHPRQCTTAKITTAAVKRKQKRQQSDLQNQTKEKYTPHSPVRLTQLNHARPKNGNFFGLKVFALFCHQEYHHFFPYMIKL